VSLAREHAVFEKDRSATMSDGTEIAYTVVGEGSKVPIVFLNGWTCSDAYWAGIGPGVIDAGHRAVFLDTRGHGQSGLPRDPGPFARNLKDEDVSVTRVANDMVEVLDDAGLERAVFAGHSMGVQAIFELYRVAPDRAAALVPVAGTFENPVKTFADKAFLDRLYPVADVLFRWVPFEVLRPAMRRAASPKLGHRVVRAIKVAGPKVTEEHITPHIAQISEVNFSVLWRMMSGLRAHSTADVLPRVGVPTLVLAGRRDLFTPPSVQQKMADLIPDSEIVWFEDAGHMLPIEEPELIVDALLAFLDRRVA
jgi:pimeloyl-ACP methyl ester carboxylesterase